MRKNLKLGGKSAKMEKTLPKSMGRHIYKRRKTVLDPRVGLQDAKFVELYRLYYANSTTDETLTHFYRVWKEVKQSPHLGLLWQNYMVFKHQQLGSYLNALLETKYLDELGLDRVDKLELFVAGNAVWRINRYRYFHKRKRKYARFKRENGVYKVRSEVAKQDIGEFKTLQECFVAYDKFLWQTYGDACNFYLYKPYQYGLLKKEYSEED